MDKLFGAVIASFLITLGAAVPFINLLYRLKFQRQKEKKSALTGEANTIVSKLHSWKVGTPNAGGLLIIAVTILLSSFFYRYTKYHLNLTAITLYVTLISFGALGFYDDIHKFFGWNKSGNWGLKARYKLIMQLGFGILIGWLMYTQMGIHYVFIPFVGNLDFGMFYIGWVALVVTSMANAVNITDGLDGLASGLTLIALTAFWYLAAQTNLGDITLFIAVMMGSILAFLYFNIFPARVWVGDTGSMAFGAMLGVVALLINMSFVLPFICLVFVGELLSSLIQLFSKAFWHRKIFLAAPIHHHFEAKGWDETKVTMRFWLAGVVSAFLGLFIAALGSKM